jgi:antitoxin MazE
MMKLQVSKWGNSLAVRLPVECTRAAGLKEGDRVEATITQAGTITLAPEKSFDKATFLTRIARLHALMPMTLPVVETMRQDARY